MSNWLRNPHVQEAIRTIIIAVLVAVLGLLGYDAQVAQPRISGLLSEPQAISAAGFADAGAADADATFTMTIHCQGGACHGTTSGLR